MAKDTEILLRLKRQYSKEETVNLCNSEISRLKIELGIQKSEVDRLEYELAKLEQENKILKDSNSALKELNRKLTTNQGLRILRAENRELKRKYDSLRSFLISRNIMPDSTFYNIN